MLVDPDVAVYPVCRSAFRLVPEADGGWVLWRFESILGSDDAAWSLPPLFPKLSANPYQVLCKSIAWWRCAEALRRRNVRDARSYQ